MAVMDVEEIWRRERGRSSIGHGVGWNGSEGSRGRELTSSFATREVSKGPRSWGISPAMSWRTGGVWTRRPAGGGPRWPIR